MTFATPDMLPPNKAKDKYLAAASITFEALPHFLGFNEDVIVRGVKVDTSRQIITFTLAGEGLTEDLDRDVNLDHFEGQEPPEIIPPAWREGMYQ